MIGAALLFFLAVGMAVTLAFGVIDLLNGAEEELAQSINVLAMALICSGALIGGTVVLTKGMSLPKKLELKMSTFVQSHIPDNQINPYKRVALRNTVIYASVAILYIIGFIVCFWIAEGIWFWITLLAGVTLFGAGTLIFALSMKPLKKKQIELFEKIYDYRVLPDFVSDGKYEFDLINHSMCAFNKDGFVIKSTVMQAMLKGAEQDPFAGFSQECFFGYDEIELYAEAHYRSWGDMMAVYVVAQIKQTDKAVQALNYLYAEGDSEGLPKEMQLPEEDFPFFMFELSKELYNKLKSVNAPVKDMDKLLENRLADMKKNCNAMASTAVFGKL